MRRVSLLYPFLWTFLAIPVGVLAENTTERTVVDLDQVWAYEIPNTRPMIATRREGKYISDEGSLINDIRTALGSKGRVDNRKIFQCFPVTGIGTAAFDEIGAILNGSRMPSQSFPIGQRVSLVICSTSTEHRFTFERIVRYFNAELDKARGNTVDIRLKTLPANQATNLPQLAVIPLGPMPQGIVRVRIELLNVATQDNPLAKKSSVTREWRCSFSGYPLDRSAPPSPESKWPREQLEIPNGVVNGLNVPGAAALNDTDLIKIVRRLPLGRQFKHGEAKPGFAVSDTGERALRLAHDVLVRGDSPASLLPADKSVSLVFFSGPAGSAVHLHEIVRNGHQIDLKYSFAQPAGAQVTEHVALIPLGHLPPGKYDVNIARVTTDSTRQSLGIDELPKETGDRIVCQSFSFVVSSSETK
jgi:hypothetical protein